MNPDQTHALKNNESDAANNINKYWRLMKCDLIKTLNQTEINDMLKIVVEKSYKKGEDIYIEGKNLSSNLYIIKKGTIKVTNYTKNGKEIIKSIFKEGEIFGILNLFDSCNHDEDYVTALEDSHICVLNINHFKNMMDENPILQNYIFKLMGLQIKKLEKNVTSLLCKDSKRRIQNFIINYVIDFGENKGDFFVAKNVLSNKDIGLLTSTCRQTVNKTLNILKQEKIIDYNKQVILVKRDTIYMLKSSCRLS